MSRYDESCKADAIEDRIASDYEKGPARIMPGIRATPSS